MANVGKILEYTLNLSASTFNKKMCNIFLIIVLCPFSKLCILFPFSTLSNLIYHASNSRKHV